MHQDVMALFHEVADLPPASREDWYACGCVPADVRAEIESLLCFDQTRGGSMTGMVGAAAEQFLLASAPVSEDGRCGPYRLIRVLGNGGMGAVYLAERADGEIEQQVAVKFVRTGADLPSFRERFLRERQILASLNHPGIARLLDAGHSGGHPYLVMEYVDGIRIDEYAAGLPLGEIVTLFVRVAEAVAYAHRNLIVHRDLKPSNILVDAAGQPKLLDFGIAKILDEPEVTSTQERVLTPEYASPEQRRGEAQSTATDIYSLGAVFRRLVPEPPADLASILDKAMREEPEERYASAELLIAELEAFLEHRPVKARRGNLFYVARKFLRRRWVPMAAGALALAGVAGGALVAHRERTVSQTRFEQVRQISRQFLELDGEIKALPGSTKARNRIVSGSLENLERLAAEARPARWSHPARQDLDLALEIGAAYLQVARVQGVPSNSNLGQFGAAGKSLSRADSFVEPVLGVPGLPQRRKALLLAAEIAHDSMILAHSQSRPAEARAWADTTAARLETLLAPAPSGREDAATAARLYANVALTYCNLHDLQQGSRYARRAVALSRAAGDPRQLSKGLSILASASRFAGDLDGALQAAHESRVLAEQVANPEDTDSIFVLCGAIWREGLILGELNNISLDRRREAEPLLQRALDISEAGAGKDPQDFRSRSYVSMAGRELGDILRDSDPARALAVYEQSRRRVAEIRNNPKARAEEVWLLTGASYALRRLGRPAESMARIDAAFAILRGLKVWPAERVEPGDEADTTLRALADHYAETGRPDAAIRTCEELKAKVQAWGLRPRTDLRHANNLSRLDRDLGNLYLRAGRVDEARALFAERLELWRYWDQKLPNNPFVRRQLSDARKISC